MKSVDGHLARAGAMMSATDHSERSILGAAQEMLDRVNKEIEQIKGEAITDEAMGQRYMDLVVERGTLQSVIANSGKHLQS